MTKDDIIRLAREAGIKFEHLTIDGVKYAYRYVKCNNSIGGDEAWCIEYFGKLVSLAESQRCQADIERWKATAEKWRSLACAKDVDGRTVQQIQQEAAANERESCAKVCENHDEACYSHLPFELAAAIRTRGQA